MKLKPIFFTSLFGSFSRKLTCPPVTAAADGAESIKGEAASSPSAKTGPAVHTSSAAIINETRRFAKRSLFFISFIRIFPSALF